MTVVTIHRRYDALVVGARCAGAATAMLLARRGLRVLAIDRGTYGSDTLSTHALMRGAVMQLARWDLLDRLKAAGTPPMPVTTFDYGDEVVSIPIRPGDGVDALYAPRRTVLDRILVDAARDAGADVRHGWTLADLLRDGTGRVRGAVVVDADGAASEVRADIVIGADGVRSRVAELAGAETRVSGKPPAGRLLFGYFGGVPDSGCRWIFRPGLMTGAIPTNGGESCVFAGGRLAEVAGTGVASPEALFRACLAASAPELAEAVARGEPAGRLRQFGGVRGHLRQAHGPGWALVGDAGYFKDPATAHGITDAFRDAELLARAVASGSPLALADYEHLRDALSLPLFRVTEAIAAFDWTTEEVKGRHAALSEAMRTEAAVLAAINAATPLPALPALTAGRRELALAG
ncbi:MAG TPA: NAD(P)/FAD-dependent oxidoreductase [Thermohalobaculum sp.]|nr:NAD(P)/FAD-dependent oxidoreductase [Thermohalobaculum sp.]